MNPIAKLNSYINSAIPYAWDDSESWYEFLAKVLSKVNELVEKSNQYFSVDLVDYVSTVLETWRDDGTLTNIIVNTLGSAANVKFDNSAGLFPSDTVEAALHTIGKYMKSSINVLTPPLGLTPADPASPDNSAALNAMIASVPGDVELFFPPGTYYIMNPILIEKSGVTLRGLEQSSIIRNNGVGDAIRVISDGYLNRISILGLRIYGNENSGFGINCPQVGTRLVIRDCEVSWHGDAGAYIYRCYSAVIYSSNFSSNCAKLTATKIANLWIDTSHNFVVHGCHMVGSRNNTDGMRVVGTHAGVIDGCQIEDNNRYGLYIASSKAISLSGNYIENNCLTMTSGQFNMYITGASTNKSEGITMNGNLFNGAGLSQYGLSVTQTRGLVVNGMFSYRNTVASIRLGTGCVDAIINNVFTKDDNPEEKDPALVSDSATNTLWNQGGVQMLPKVPTSATAAGVKGQMVCDATHIYVCTDLNTWKRIPLPIDW